MVLHNDGDGPRHMTLQQFRAGILDVPSLPDFVNNARIFSNDLFIVYDQRSGDNRPEEVNWGQMMNQAAGLGIGTSADSTLGTSMYVGFEDLNEEDTLESNDFIIIDDLSEGATRAAEKIQFDNFGDEVEDEIEVGRDQLKTGIMNQAGDGPFEIPEYAFLPRRTSQFSDCVLAADIIRCRSHGGAGTQLRTWGYAMPTLLFATWRRQTIRRCGWFSLLMVLLGVCGSLRTRLHLARLCGLQKMTLARPCQAIRWSMWGCHPLR